MDLYKNPQEHFSQGEYVLTDSAYGLTLNCIPAYKAPAANLSDNTAFNYCLARSRVMSGHCIGVLKSRWASLREMRQQIRCRKVMEILVDWVEACCLLHNMLACLGEMYLEEKEQEAERNIQDEWLADADTFREELKGVTLRVNLQQGVLAPIA